MRLRIVVGADAAGCDHAGVPTRDLHVGERGSEVASVGVRTGEGVSHPVVAIAAPTMVAEGIANQARSPRGTDMGVAMSTNNDTGIRAAAVHDSLRVECFVPSNKAQVLTFGKRVIGVEPARRPAKEWLGCIFDPARHSAQKSQHIVHSRKNSALHRAMSPAADSINTFE